MLVAGSGVFAMTTRAAEETKMSPEHIERIKANCIEAQSIMNRIHTNDALLRVNRGQLYETISTKLMSRLNSRISENRLDGGALVTVTAEFDAKASEFRSEYIEYDKALSRALNISCQNQPVAFYDAVSDANKRRGTVNEITKELEQLTKDYSKEFEAFAKKIEDGDKS